MGALSLLMPWVAKRKYTKQRFEQNGIEVKSFILNAVVQKALMLAPFLHLPTYWQDTRQTPLYP
ncbi:hypothetical protein VCRA2133E348_210068 [Vibrio crassostreae]|nr:hypothetical protein VCRA2119O48_200071 [Vibrio crassostreae]CAK2771597.1 hypothetical protein VCRA2133E348_210068 [Vibrio crassostreae]CAK3220546.1 hypothetical protein VCRA213O314_190031 [Vibrio crassostreae]CAK3839837.1 hypothetical protein VCRA212O16_210071 [Vibrio crassostreae]